MSKRNRKNLPRALLDIVIPVYGKLDFLQKCLDCIPQVCWRYFLSYLHT